MSPSPELVQESIDNTDRGQGYVVVASVWLLLRGNRGQEGLEYCSIIEKAGCLIV